MIQYKNFVEKDQKLIQEMFLNLIKLFSEIQIKKHKGFIPFNLKLYKTKQEKVERIPFNDIRLKKIEVKNGMYRFYMPNNQLFQGEQRVFNKKMQRELEIVNYSRRFFDFSVFPFEHLKNDDIEYINGNITYKELMKNRDYLNVYYKYIEDKINFNEELKMKSSGDGRVMDLKLSNPSSFDNFKLEFKNLDGIKVEEYDEPFVVFLVSLYNKKIHIYKIGVTEFFEKMENFDTSIDEIINKNINVFDKERFELQEFLNLQLNGKNTSNLFGIDKFEKIKTIGLDDFRNSTNWYYQDKFKLKISKPSEYEIKDDDGFVFVLPYIQCFKNLKMFNPNVIEIDKTIKMVYQVDGGEF